MGVFVGEGGGPCHGGNGWVWEFFILHDGTCDLPPAEVLPRYPRELLAQAPALYASAGFDCPEVQENSAPRQAGCRSVGMSAEAALLPP